MRYHYLLLSFLIIGLKSLAQTTPVYNAYQQEMNVAYQQYPTVPKGMLEAVAFKMTHFSHINDAEDLESCFGLPRVYGVMGLTENGQGYFRSNLSLVSQLSGYSVAAIKSNPQTNILAYAAAYNQLLTNLNIGSADINKHGRIIAELSEIPLDQTPGNDYAMNARLYGIFNYLKESNVAISAQVNLTNIFGENNLKVLSSGIVTIDQDDVSSNNGTTYIPTQLKSTEYGPAIWVATPSCNRSSRSGTAVSAVTVHTIQGSYAGAISWAQNCSSNVSYHYVARSSDGQITQMVLEAQKAWHVGNANPYTIGIEHEGYVNNASWYTNAMYVGSANLVKDITQSGYGILPIRTYFGAASSGINTLGACTKIKGHQHFPSQNHTDPGINWNWKKYYNLINNTTAPTVTTAATGTYYDSGGASGNYSNDERKLYLIQPTGASTVTISFSQFDLEANWDYMLVYNGATANSPLLATLTGSSIPSNLTSTGGSMLIEFRSDCATPKAGWKLSWTSNGSGGGGGPQQDITPPSTVVTSPNTWETTTFNASFTDTDNAGGSGVGEKYYQVIDFDGTDWKANDANGFLKDNFNNTISGDWAQQTGTWAITGSRLVQSDETVDNSNIFALLDQNTQTRYLYNWSGKMEGTGVNKRSGIHFMSDDAGLPNRKNSYFVYFRSDENKIQIYKVTNDVFTLKHDVPCTINDNQWYDYKVTYDKGTGKICVWVDDSYKGAWTDPSPITGGDYFSLRNGNCKFTVTNVNVYHNRTNNQSIKVGQAATNDIRYQNPDPTTFSGKVKSLVIDVAKNISNVSMQDINVDWTPPLAIATVNDGTGADINFTTNNTQLSANWTTSSDPHSGVNRYWYAIGTSPGATNVRAWTDNWFNTAVTATGLSLTSGATYYFSIRAENGAGLLSTVKSSDGQTVGSPTNPPVSSFTIPNAAICSNDSIAVVNNSTDATSYLWSTTGGGVLSSPTSANTYIRFTTSGSYVISLVATGPGGSNTSTQTITVNVGSTPIADATLTDSVVCLSNPMVTFVNQSQNANGYIWSFGDGTTSTDASPWHAYPGVGIYNVTLTAINGTCPNAIKQFQVTVENCSAIEEQSVLNTVIFPNPTTDNLTVIYNLPSAIDYAINVYDLTGRKVSVLYSGLNTVGSHTMHFNLSEIGLAKGNYHLVIESNQFKEVKSLVIQ